MQSVIDNDGVHVTVNQSFLSPDEATILFNAIKEKVVFLEEKGIMGNKPKRTSRAYGDDGLVYKYTNTTRDALPWFQELKDLKEKIETATGDTYTFALINHYEDGASQIPYHADNEKGLNHGSSIASVSVGAVRKFKLKENITGTTTDTFLQHGSLLVMGPGVQQKYKHAVLKSTVCHTPRYNITFRHVL